MLQVTSFQCHHLLCSFVGEEIQYENRVFCFNLSGDKSLYNTVAPLLDIMGKVVCFCLSKFFSFILFFSLKNKVTYVFLTWSFIQSRFYLGDVGNGAAMKLVVNMIMGRFCTFSYSFLTLEFVDFLINTVTMFLQSFSFGNLQYDGNFFWRVAS